MIRVSLPVVKQAPRRSASRSRRGAAVLPRAGRERTAAAQAALAPGGLAHVNSEITGCGARFTLELILRQDVLQALGSGK